MTKKDKTLKIIEILKGIYADAICSLRYDRDYELLFATRLAAQCTDARVNIVTKVLFEKYRLLEDIAAADIGEVESIVKPCGFYKMKARDIILASQMLISDFSSRVPDSMEELLKLPGVGRKTANLILGDIYGKPSIVCDTHCIRITNRLGLTTTKDPFKTEMELKKILPAKESGDFCHRLVLFGRDTCKARSPVCEVCPLSGLCVYYLKF